MGIGDQVPEAENLTGVVNPQNQQHPSQDAADDPRSGEGKHFYQDGGVSLPPQDPHNVQKGKLPGPQGEIGDKYLKHRQKQHPAKNRKQGIKSGGNHIILFLLPFIRIA